MSFTVIAHTLQPDRAFHSTLSTKIALDNPGYEKCSFFALYTFPQSVIIDSYELSDHRLSFEFWGEANLELPVFALDQTSDSVLLVNSAPAAHPGEILVDIPIHARYGEPGMVQTSHEITISAPACFWACPASASISPIFSAEPPIANSTMLSSFTHFSVPSTPSHLASLRVPVGSKRDLLLVEMGTATVIFVAFLWLVQCSWRAATVLQSPHLKEQ